MCEALDEKTCVFAAGSTLCRHDCCLLFIFFGFAVLLIDVVVSCSYRESAVIVESECSTKHRSLINRTCSDSHGISRLIPRFT